MELKKFLAISCICFSSVFGSNEIINIENPQREKHWFSKIYRTMEDAEYELSQHKNSSCIRIRKYAEDKFGFYVKDFRMIFSWGFPGEECIKYLYKTLADFFSSREIILREYNIEQDPCNHKFELINWYESPYPKKEFAKNALNKHPEIAEYFDIVECSNGDDDLYWIIMLKSELQKIYSYYKQINDGVSANIGVRKHLKTHKFVIDRRGIPLALTKRINKQLVFEDNMWKMKIISEE